MPATRQVRVRQGRHLIAATRVVRRDTFVFVNREYLWTEEGLADARRRKVALDEVDQALHAPPGLRFERRIGDLLLVVMGMADSARIIAVISEQVHRTTMYRILRVRALTGDELDEWRRRVL